ncbi:MAG: threonine--tRNA ligase [Patescibacteria group bacterium]|nr:threonine--tRNA ligase [Patescibacteria group bacterium]
MTSLEAKRHTLAHLLAQAVLEQYPDAQLTLGPAIENGFYYDIDFGTEKISDADLPKFEASMRKHLPNWKSFASQEVSKDAAIKAFSTPAGANPYKAELVGEIESRGEKITLYSCGGFTDLCRGGHAEHPSEDIAPDSFALDRVAGAYWRGDEKNPMLTRIYGLAFDTKEELAAYKAQREEAEKRDHKKLGRELKIFTISPLVGAGLPLLQPRGAIMRREIEEYLWQLHKDKGYERVWTPHLAKEALYETSGHAAKFGDELFRVSGKDEQFFLKPMNCPHHMQIFSDNQFSYRDMPVRYFEPATVYRDEKTGQLGGLTRVRSITQDDGHLFCRVSQINQEVSTIVSVITEFYTTMGMMDGYWVSLSVRGGDRSKYLGTDEVWNEAEGALEKAAQANGLNYKRVEGEATFYGPKLDFMFKDAIGRQWQLATIQCDFNLPERFNLSFINEKGEKERPVVIHRAISGSLERFLGIAIEHYAGAFPLWLSPVQARVLPVSEKHAAYAQEVLSALKAANIRADMGETNESLGKKIREAKTEKIPYLLVVGDKETDAKTVSIDSRDHGKMDALALADFIARATEEIKARK